MFRSVILISGWCFYLMWFSTPVWTDSNTHDGEKRNVTFVKRNDCVSTESSFLSGWNSGKQAGKTVWNDNLLPGRSETADLKLGRNRFIQHRLIHCERSGVELNQHDILIHLNMKKNTQRSWSQCYYSVITALLQCYYSVTTLHWTTIIPNTS